MININLILWFVGLASLGLWSFVITTLVISLHADHVLDVSKWGLQHLFHFMLFLIILTLFSFGWLFFKGV